MRIWRRPISWTHPEDGLSAAHEHGVLLGYVVTTAAGDFVAFDAQGEPMGIHRSSRSAQKAVTASRRTSHQQIHDGQGPEDESLPV